MKALNKRLSDLERSKGGYCGPMEWVMRNQGESVKDAAARCRQETGWSGPIVVFGCPL